GLPVRAQRLPRAPAGHRMGFWRPAAGDLCSTRRVTTDVAPASVLSFWFGPAPSADAAALGSKVMRWYQGGPELDREIRQRFSGAVEAALAGELDAWSRDLGGRVALVLLLDQFTRS